MESIDILRLRLQKYQIQTSQVSIYIRIKELEDEKNKLSDQLPKFETELKNIEETLQSLNINKD